jgi:Uma2 family endonuclease
VAIVRGQLQDYACRHPSPAELALVVEVADTTLVTDRFKAQLYASAGIPVYWIVNLSERVIEVLQEPTPPTSPTHYATIRCYLPDEEIPIVVAGREVANLRVMDLLP